jgi:hypothetical protein
MFGKRLWSLNECDGEENSLALKVGAINFPYCLYDSHYKNALRDRDHYHYLPVWLITVSNEYIHAKIEN